jgi:hypothetical protein
VRHPKAAHISTRQRRSHASVSLSAYKTTKGADHGALSNSRFLFGDGSEFIVERSAAEVRLGLGLEADPTDVGAPEVEVDVKILCANAPLWS